jgi:hypothetical protein
VVHESIGDEGLVRISVDSAPAQTITVPTQPAPHVLGGRIRA